MTTRVRALRAEDHARWVELQRGYQDFYEEDQSPARVAVLWGWLLDETHEISGWVAVDQTDRIVGIAHTRPFARPLAIATGLFLDDLYVDPAVRGAGVGRAILDHLRSVAVEQGHGVVRWLTHRDNAVARGLYDQVAEASPYVTYDLRIPDGGA